MQLVIRPYHPLDKDLVLTLFSDGILEHIGPCFYNAMSSPLYLGITLGLGAAGYFLGSVLGALLLVGGWMGLVYYACHEVYAIFLREKLRTDMQDIPGNYLTQSDDCFWVAEAEVSGRAQIMGMVAMVTKQNGGERYGELFRMIISLSCRRLGLGSRMTQTVVFFCKEHGLTRLVLRTSSTHAAAVALYQKMGFAHILSPKKVMAPDWIAKLAMVKPLLMEKHIKV